MTPPGGSRLSTTDRLLRLFTDVRAGESGTALLLALNVFLFLMAYYVAKVLREPLILTSGNPELTGAQLKSYTASGQALVLALVVPLYGALAGRVPRRRLINVVTAVFVACLAGFFVLARLGLPVGIPFYIWVGIFSVMIVAQFWAFANDVYTEDEGKRLFPIVGFGASAGAVAGSLAAGPLIESFGLSSLFAISAAILVAATLITNVIESRERRRTETGQPAALTSSVLPAATGQFRAATGEFRAVADSPEYQKASGTFTALKRAATLEEAEREQIRSTAGPFALVFRNRYLLLIALLVMFLNWVNTNGEYILGDTVSRAAAAAVAEGRSAGLTEEEYIGRFFSAYFSGVNVAGLLLQLFVVSRVIKYLGVRTAVLVLPVLALAGYTVLAFGAALSVIRVVKMAENSTDYSLNNTVRNVLFLPTTREEKYKAKQVTDAFAQRAGDVLHSVLIFVATGLLALTVRQIAVINLLLVAVWLVIAVAIGRQYGRLAAATRS
jgi:AAA family ATP:ADP antiporter